MTKLCTYLNKKMIYHAYIFKVLTKKIILLYSPRFITQPLLRTLVSIVCLLLDSLMLLWHYLGQ